MMKPFPTAFPIRRQEAMSSIRSPLCILYFYIIAFHPKIYNAKEVFL